MEVLHLKSDLPILTVTAESFPMGIGGAYKKLEAALLSVKDRVFFGISRPESEAGIVYRAVALALDAEEATRLGLEAMTLKAGSYVTEMLLDWRQDETIFSKVFPQLLDDPRIDPQGYCVEWYPNDKDAMLMVRILDPEQESRPVHPLSNQAPQP